jgi:hypothetical protein
LTKSEQETEIIRMGKKKEDQKSEFFIRCPLYTKQLDQCPSSSGILMKQDMEKLIKHCLSDNYTSCKLLESFKEKSQAA